MTSDRRPLTSLTPPAEALAALLRRLHPVAPKVLPVAEALGRVLAEPIRALRPVPAAPVALKPGWAVRADDTSGAGPYGPVPLPEPPVRVAPGDPLPAGTDAVLDPFELEDGPFPQVLAPVAPGEGVRAAGEDLPAGTTLRAAGERLRACDLPALAALGVTEVAVRIPCLGWFGAPDPALAALVAEAGAEIGPDPALLLTRDGAALEEVLVPGLGARPGMATALGTIRGTPAVLLPGTAEEVHAAWLLILRPALWHLAGAPPPAPRRARLARKVASTVGLAEIVPLRLQGDLAEPLAVGALPLWAIAAAEGVLLVPPAAEGYEAGAEISVLPP
jgi:molybdopterin biosynthesis enzyme